MQRYKDYGAEEVEAERVTPQTVKDIVEWCDGVEVLERNPFNPSETYAGVNVPTPSRTVRASEGYYVIKDHNGEFRVMKHSAFHSMYTPV